MQKKITSALISVYYKDGLENIVQLLHQLSVKIYSTGGTQQFIEGLGIPCVNVESVTNYPAILGGRVKTLHPGVFGGILARRDNATDLSEMKQFDIPFIDLVIVDLYPFEETVRAENDEHIIIEKIDIGGPSMIRAAAKNFKDVMVVAAKRDYLPFLDILKNQQGETTLEQRKTFASKAFDICTGYDLAISNYFNGTDFNNPFGKDKNILRYGENPHQKGIFLGDEDEIFDKLHGKELSYNNIVDVDAAMQLINEFHDLNELNGAVFAIIKHTNVCGAAVRETLKDAWDAALAGDPTSAFGGVLVCNTEVDKATAIAINELFFEVIIAAGYDGDALDILRTKKNRIILMYRVNEEKHLPSHQFKSVLNGILTQQNDVGNFLEWKEVGGRQTDAREKKDLIFANIICKHLKSNAIALVKNQQLIGKGCGQTSRIDAVHLAIAKAHEFKFDTQRAVLSSDAFFPFNDCVKVAHTAGVEAFIQPGGSIRDEDSIQYCKENNLAMVLTGMRHFKH